MHNWGDAMKLSSKVKYVAAGAISAVVLVPLIVKAVETIPLSFQEGDVISAGVMNALLQRLNDTTKGYTSVDELVGTYTCVTYDNNGHASCPSGTFALNDGIYSASQTITFTKISNNKLTFSASTVAPGGCGHNALGYKTGTLTLVGGTMVANSVTSSWQDIRKLSPTRFKWDSGLPYAFTQCVLTSTPPAPAGALTASASGSNVTLTWTDQSSDETGFKVERKSSATSAWSAIATTSANATSYTDSGLTAGTYWYRVIATNNYGDAMSSSEVQAVVQ